MKSSRENNKGFSLVELVVVVLIMGVLAVSLAPQVVKWVAEARKGADSRVRDNLKSVAQAAVAEYENEIGDVEEAYYHVTAAGVVTSDGAADPNAGMIAILTEVMGGELPKVQNETGKVYQMGISDTGVVSISIESGTY